MCLKCTMYTALVLHLVILILSLTTGNASILPHHTDNNIPSEWSTMCSVVTTHNNRNITFSCHVTLKDEWDFNEFRNWSAKLDNNTVVTLDIVCDANGTVCLPWPYRAEHLHTLKVRGCVNVCFVADYSRPEFLETITDNLRVFEGYDITTISTIQEVISIKMKNLPPSLECGPLLIETYIYRGSKNIITTPEGEMPIKDEDITDTLTKNIQDINDLDHICRYVNMRVYDVSQRVDASTSYLYTTIANSRFPQLRTLNLSQTELQKFPTILSVWRRRFENLEYLDLSYNNISRFDIRDMSLISKDVGVIDLSHNNIRTIGVPEIKSFGNVDKAVIDVRQNPFECNCAMSNFSHYLQKHKEPAAGNLDHRYIYLWELRCVSPSRFSGRRIAELTQEMLCSTDVTTYIAQITVLSIAVVVLLIVIILMARYRKEIRILAFTRLHIVLPCQPAETSCKKRYDAFVAYSHLDTTWVVKTLLPRLENGSGVGGNFKLCLHQRDFEVGAAIADNIVQSVEASRHTILVLSKNFLESEWCLMEFRTAFHQSLIEKKKHLIIVLLEDIPPHDLDSDLRRCLQTLTYIHISDRLFWDRIVYSLTDKSETKWKLFLRQSTDQTEKGYKENHLTPTIVLQDKKDMSLDTSSEDTFPYEFADEVHM